MPATHHPRPDDPAMRHPPTQSMPPAPDLQFVVPPTDPVGLPQQPIAATEPVRNDGKRTSRYLALGIVVLVVAGIALLISFAS